MASGLIPPEHPEEVLESGACIGKDPLIFDETYGLREYGVSEEDQIALAKSICATCPVVEPCLEWANKNPIWADGYIYGGMTSEERGLPRLRIVKD